jgi:arsenate reductase (glutaredoxin)
VVKNSGVPFEVIEYLKAPPTKSELKNILKGLKRQPLEIFRTKDKLFKELGYSKTDLRTVDEWLEILVDNPRLLERPVVVYQNKYKMGRPPEKVLEILG